MFLSSSCYYKDCFYNTSTYDSFDTTISFISQLVKDEGIFFGFKFDNDVKIKPHVFEHYNFWTYLKMQEEHLRDLLFKIGYKETFSQIMKEKKKTKKSLKYFFKHFEKKMKNVIFISEIKKKRDTYTIFKRTKKFLKRKDKKIQLESGFLFKGSIKNKTFLKNDEKKKLKKIKILEQKKRKKRTNEDKIEDFYMIKRGRKKTKYSHALAKYSTGGFLQLETVIKGIKLISNLNDERNLILELNMYAKKISLKIEEWVNEFY